jgi:ABC-type branched-subunit amino acid transport system ATPase component
MHTWEAPDVMLELRAVTTGYGNIDVVHDFSMRLDDGEIACIIGPNGAGKSTILKTVVGIVKPRQGRVFLNGEDVTGLEPHVTLEKGICMLPQGRTAFPTMTVLENLQMGAYIVKDPKKVRERLDQAYNLFPILAERRRDLANRLSGGELAMLCVARALMSDPKIMLLDEPSLGLAPKVTDYLYQKIAEINSSGSSIVIVEQNVRKALSAANYAYVLSLGRKRFEGKPEALSSDDRVKELFWSSKN